MSNTSGKRDVILNFLSIGLLGISGVALNVGVGYFYDAATLGILNQVIAIYIIFSQLSSGGLQLSILHSVGKQNTDLSEDLHSVLIVHFKMLLGIAIFWTMVLILTADLWAQILGSDPVSIGCWVIAPGLLFFSFNKFFLGVINGQNRMKDYAFYQCLRYAGVLLLLIGFFVFRWDGSLLPFVFTGSEGFLFLVFLFRFGFLWRKLSRYRLQWSEHKKYLIFGFQSLISGALLELNSRVDVLIIGFFLSDRETGIYSFAALFVEGLSQFLVVLQNIYNPRLGRLLHERKFLEFNQTVRQTAQKVYGAGIILVPLAIFLFPYGLQLMHVSTEFHQSWKIFGILMTGIWLASGFYPFHTIFVMAGQPVRQTLFMMSIAVMNIILNLAFVPVWGVYGSAIATALAVASSALSFQYFRRALVEPSTA